MELYLDFRKNFGYLIKSSGEGAWQGFLDIVDQDPSDSKSNRLVKCSTSSGVAFNLLRHIHVDSSTMIGNSLEVLNFNQLFLKLGRFSPEQCYMLKGDFTHESQAVTMRLWEPKRTCPKTVPTHIPNHETWSRTLECGLKSYVISSSTNCYFNELLFMWVLMRDEVE